MKTNVSYSPAVWRVALGALCLGIVAYLLYFHNVTQLLPGFSSTEVATYKNASDWHYLVHNPVNLPYKLVLWLTIVLGHHGFLQTRLVSAVFGTTAVLLFYYVIYRWYGSKTAILVTILFAASSGLLHIARLGSVVVLQLAILALVAAAMWYRRSVRYRTMAGYILLLLLAVLLYIPGMLWIELIGLIVYGRQAFQTVQRPARLHIIIYSVLGLIAISPLVIASIRHTSILLDVLGLPIHISQLRHVPTGIEHALGAVSVRSDGNPLYFVGHTPFLSIVGLLLLIIGLYTSIRQGSTKRSVFLYASLIAAVVLFSLGGSVNYPLLLALIYLIIAGGIHELIARWLQVFPRNPIARSAGITFIAFMIGFAVLYQTRSYFVAWPHTPLTRQTFSHLQP